MDDATTNAAVADGSAPGGAAATGAGYPVAAADVHPVADPTSGGVATAAPGRRKPRQILVWLAIAWLGVVVFCAIFGSFLPLDPGQTDYSNRLATPGTAGHLLGTDNLGRDVFARLVAGARISVTIGVSAVAIGMVVGGGIGLLVGYFRGWMEGLAMWVINVILAFPGLVLLLGLITFAGQSLTAITIVIGLLSVPTYARMARATTLAVAQREYVLSAKAMGATNRRIMFSEILPNVVLPVAAFGLVALGTLMVIETALAFLGLSVNSPTWGSMIADGRRHLHVTNHLAFIPSFVLFLTVLSVNFVGDHARSRFDVKESRL